MEPRYFYGFILGFIFGISVEDVLGFGVTLSFLFIALAITLFFLGVLFREERHSFVVSCALLGIALGVFRVALHDEWALRQIAALEGFVGAPSVLRGTVANDPDSRDGHTNIVLEVATIAWGTSDHADDLVSHAVSGNRVLVRTAEYPLLAYGDEVLVLGAIRVPKSVLLKNGDRKFSYAAYLAKNGIFYEMHYPNMSVLAHGKGNSIREKLLSAKSLLMHNIARMIPEPESSLAAGILLGAKQSLGKDLLQQFRDTGLAHIVVLSGYNIAVVAAAISRMVLPLPFIARMFASAVGIVAFAIMVGGGATVVRATVMGVIVILARALGRERAALRALMVAGTLMLLYNPMLLLSDVSFQLSFIATLALIVFVPVLENYFFGVSRSRRAGVLREIFLATIATQIFVLPLLLYHMGSASIIGVLANLIVLPAVPLAMLTVALVSMLASVPLVGALLGYVSYAVLTYIIFIVELFAKIPYGSLHIKTFPLVLLVASYVALGYIVLKKFPRSTNSSSLNTKTSSHEF